MFKPKYTIWWFIISTIFVFSFFLFPIGVIMIIWGIYQNEKDYHKWLLEKHYEYQKTMNNNKNINTEPLLKSDEQLNLLYKQKDLLFTKYHNKEITKNEYNFQITKLLEKINSF